MDLGTGGLRVVASGESGDTTSLRDTIGGLSPNDLRDVPRAPGARVGRYIVLERVGHGGMGVVYAAFDPELNRRVALKILHPDGPRVGLVGAARARMQREAQAMARVSHPNAISVFDVGECDGSVFVAMEFVDGSTLRQWLELASPPVADIVAMFVQAARGLAAAHAAGLVHRDFKPDNVMVGHDGLARVLDFGLARTEASLTAGDDEEHPAPRRAAGDTDVLSSQLTRVGAIVGTPRYMAPEQHAGVAADTRCDQYAFCVALYEALYLRDAFVAESSDALALAKLKGQVQPPPADARVPAWLGAVIVRGLAPDPNDRWPDMHALVGALGRDPAHARRRRARSWGIAALVTGASVAILLATRAGDEPCADAEQHLAGVWDDGRRMEVRAALVAVDVPYAATAAERVERTLDAYAHDWVATRNEACHATLVRREHSSTLFDRQLGCLADRRRALDAVVTALSGADAAMVERAQQTTRALPNLAACTNTEYLFAALDPPPADVAVEVDAVRDAIARARALDHGGRSREAATVAEDAHAQAVAIGYAPLVAEALMRRGVVADALGDYGGAERSLVDALALALAEGHDEAAAHSAQRLVGVVGVQLAHYEEGLRWARVARGMYAKLELEGDVVAAVDMAEANVLFRMGEYRRAGESYERAIEAIEAEHGPDDARLVQQLTNLGNVLVRETRLDDALASYERAGRIAAEQLGAEHPHVGVALAGASHVLSDMERFDEAEARALAARDVFVASFGPDHPHVIAQECNLGIFREGRGDLEGSLVDFEHCRKRQSALYGADHPEVGRVLFNLGRIHAELGQFEVARVELEQSVAIQRAKLGSDHDGVAATIVVLGELELRTGAHAKARDLFAEALAVFERKTPDRAETGRARFAWARASRLAGGPEAEARAAATRARSEIASAGGTAEELAAIDAWLR
jgi:eukaryotic-like serine/threonine-protein kinase